MTIEVTSFSELQKILSENDEVVVDFSATWCGPCKVFRRHFDAASERVDVPFVNVYVDKVDDVQEHYGVYQVPTVKHFKDGLVRDLKARTAVPLLREITSN